MSTQEKKRAWADDVDSPISIAGSSSPSRPPLKKRFTGFSSATAAPYTPASTTVSNEPTAPEPSPTPLESPTVQTDELDTSLTFPENVSKTVLLRRMRKVKENVALLENRMETMTQDENRTKSSQSIVRIHYNMLRDELIFSGKSLFDVDDSLIPELPEDPAITGEHLQESLDIIRQALIALASRVLEPIQNWTTKANALEDALKATNDGAAHQNLLQPWSQSEIKDLRSSTDRTHKLVSEMRNQHEALSIQTNGVKNQLQTTTDRLTSMREAFDDCIQKLVQAEKRYDRSKSAVVASLAYGGLGDLEMQAANGKLSSPPAEGNARTSTVAKETKPVTPGSIADQAIQSQLNEHQLIVDARKKEMEDLKREREQLLSDIESLKSQFLTISDEQLLETQYVKNLQLSIDHYRSRLHYLDHWRTRLEKDLDNDSIERRQIMDQAKNEKNAQTQSLEAEMKRLENDLTRIRGQRDQFQTLLNELTNRDNRDRAMNDQVRLSADEAKQHVDELELHLRTLQETMASSSQDKAGPLANELAMFTQLKDNLDHARRTLEALKRQSQQDVMNTRSLQEAQHVHRSQVESIQNKLRIWIDDGEKLPTSIRTLMKQLNDLSTQYNQLQLMIDFYDSYETQLLQQIDRAAAMYGKLDEQSAKISKQCDKRECKLKLQAEKSKFAQTFPALKMAKDKQMATVASLRRTSEQQREHLRQLEERGKAVEKQLDDKENEVRSTAKAVEDCRVEIEDVTLQCGECKNTLDECESRVLELQKLLKEKTRAFEEEKHLRKRVDEDYEKMKRKWDMISQGHNPAEQELAAEVEELRALLKCSACRTNFRSRLLGRCMHTFCKECIEARLDTRQRRCPSCGESFGVGDVRHFYL
ncbi:uncharacterized protein BYT42DRAFT_614885 [Radiomyces spectabilis]|uniref:uncharacterized protein n=1 Tax=Radiomyces spectabilis TaxID=64574 RepID=UPI00221F361F|nr:uncharacterized protein BYT42DRAFT_614885 [Radiomyces spectabilis]KAI8376102.1 hypothetical protein BYT42DRAFT_614885 [Radiomyces spectabilis]